MARETVTASERVLGAVANTADTDPLELPPLYAAVDPDALESLVSTMADGEVVFDYAGYEVTITSERAVALEETATDCSPTTAATVSN